MQAPHPATDSAPADGLLPDFCNVRNVFLLVLLTELLALVLALALPAEMIVFWQYLAMVSLLMQWIALLNALLLCHLRPAIHRLREPLAIAVSLSLMLLVSLLVGALARYLAAHFLALALDEAFLWRLLAISLAVYAVLLRYFYVQQQWRSNLAAHSRARIQALQARIRPHFLFNSMNTIASLISIDPARAERAIEDLSELFRASLREQMMHALGEEIALVRSYLAMEKLRLDTRLQVDWQVDEKLEAIMIPALCLQPLVENAIYHGIEPLPEGGKITISALQKGKHLHLSVCNPAAGQPSRRQGNRIAQDNIRQRLQLYYGDAAAFTINDTKDQYCISLSLPLSTPPRA